MKRESAFLMLLLIILVASSFAPLGVPRVEASGTIYIRADGSIDPPDAPISIVDNFTYTLTGNITAFTDGIVIERDNIVVDGVGYTLTGSGVNGNGATLTDRCNVTVRNMTIKNFTCGILLDSSPNNTLSGNNISGNEATGISLYFSPNNVLSGNTVEGSPFNLVIYGETLSDYLLSIDTSNLVERKPVYYFINQSDMVVDTDTYPKVGYLGFVNCVNVTVQALNLTENGDGILLAFTSNSKITGNNVTNQSVGIWLKYSFDITLSDNNIARAQGLEKYKQFLTVLLKAFPDWHETIEDIIAEGDKVWCRFRATATQTGEYRGYFPLSGKKITLAPTGKKITPAGFIAYRIVNGKIVEGWEVSNLLDIYTQLGVIEPTEKAKELFPE
jgi:parallel beta-helix repeat protein